MSNPAIELLTQAAHTCEQNAKIQATEGNIDQASLSQGSAVSYRAAILILRAASGGSGLKPSEVHEALSAINKLPE